MRLRALSWMMAAMLAAITAPAGAAMILKMNLAQLTDRADVSVANCQLSGSRELIQATAVGLPLIVVKVNHAASFISGLADRSAAIQ